MCDWSKYLTSNIYRGASLCYAIYHHHRSLISHIITVCVPYSPPRTTYISLDDIATKILPNFAYQLQFRSGEVEKVVRTGDDIRQFLISLYGGKTVDGKYGWTATQGIFLDRLHCLSASRLLRGEVCYLLRSRRDIDFQVKHAHHAHQITRILNST